MNSSSILRLVGILLFSFGGYLMYSHLRPDTVGTSPYTGAILLISGILFVLAGRAKRKKK